MLQIIWQNALQWLLVLSPMQSWGGIEMQNNFTELHVLLLIFSSKRDVVIECEETLKISSQNQEIFVVKCCNHFHPALEIMCSLEHNFYWANSNKNKVLSYQYQDHVITIDILESNALSSKKKGTKKLLILTDFTVWCSIIVHCNTNLIRKCCFKEIEIVVKKMTSNHFSPNRSINE